VIRYALANSLAYYLNARVFYLKEKKTTTKIIWQHSQQQTTTTNHAEMSGVFWFVLSKIFLL